MKKKLMTALALVLVVAMSVAGTYAYLTSTQTVTNTFTVGKVGITLDEAKTNLDGEKVNKDGNPLAEGAADYRIPNNEDKTSGNAYKLMPGHEYVKDPTVHVTAGSEACYVFVKVDDEIAEIEVNDEETPNVATQIAGESSAKYETYGWTQLKDSNDNNVTGVYYKEVDAADAKAGTSLQVFGGFMIKGDGLTNKQLAEYDGKTITVTAYAVQADGFSTAIEAWNANFAGA